MIPIIAAVAWAIGTVLLGIMAPYLLWKICKNDKITMIKRQKENGI